ncbi:MAG: peptidyl-prolyl cis-trans isomerase [Burkholderia sp.]|jgi:peptidyl-prolyl cis-trans isomerase C|uniref:peptidylprolyl isomerase n=1 Tax=Burkholderia sp. TaxID=36773 RepID=UPI0028179123|nr:peptidylprolyl isomerase [Burkholderia sp.]MDR0246354.1 peptidyl-prolyl cis-trans isomerase [Burkholderia sp.]
MNDVLSDAPVALRINGVAIDDAAIAAEAAHHGDVPDPLGAARRALAVRELLRQRAVALALLDEGAPLDDAAVDALLERELTHLPEPDRADCERYYAQHPARFRRNDIVYASHVLFAMTDRVPLAPLRQRAEQALAEVVAAPETFDAVARASSNCPSAAVGGSLGQLLRGDTVPEFEAALFDTDGIGVLPKLVNTRFGFHIVRIERRVEGDTVPFDEAAGQIAAYLSERVRQRAMRQYVAILAGSARVEGVEFDGANGPLVQ